MFVNASDTISTGCTLGEGSLANTGNNTYNNAHAASNTYINAGYVTVTENIEQILLT